MQPHAAPAARLLNARLLHHHATGSARRKARGVRLRLPSGPRASTCSPAHQNAPAPAAGVDVRRRFGVLRKHLDPRRRVDLRYRVPPVRVRQRGARLRPQPAARGGRGGVDRGPEVPRREQVAGNGRGAHGGQGGDLGQGRAVLKGGAVRGARVPAAAASGGPGPTPQCRAAASLRRRSDTLLALTPLRRNAGRDRA